MKEVSPRKMTQGLRTKTQVMASIYVIKLNLGSIHEDRLKLKYFDECQHSPYTEAIRHSFLFPFTLYVLLKKPRITNKIVGATVIHSGNNYLLSIFQEKVMPDHKKQALTIRFTYVHTYN